jgi:hypothetical protein
MKAIKKGDAYESPANILDEIGELIEDGNTLYRFDPKVGDLFKKLF